MPMFERVHLMDDAALRSTVQALVDERDISRVILRYAEGIDRRDYAQVESCFAHDAEIDGSAFQGDRDFYLSKMFEALKRYPTTQHHVGNQLCEITGDTASTETYLIASHFFDDAGTQPGRIVGMRIRETLRREPDGRWVITGRVARQMWKMDGLPPKAAD